MKSISMTTVIVKLTLFDPFVHLEQLAPFLIPVVALAQALFFNKQICTYKSLQSITFNFDVIVLNRYSCSLLRPTALLIDLWQTRFQEHK